MKFILISIFFFAAVANAQTPVPSVGTGVDSKTEVKKDKQYANPVKGTSEVKSGINDPAPQPVKKEEETVDPKATPPKSMSGDIDKPN